jgi:hypothetical protein
VVAAVLQPQQLRYRSFALNQNLDNLKHPASNPQPNPDHIPSRVSMNINFGPKHPTWEVRIKVGQQLLRIASGKIQDAAWETVQDSEVQGFDVSDLDCISYDSESSIFDGDTICYTLWKQPKKCKYLVMWENIQDFGAFLLQGGSNTSLMTKTGLIACLAKSCYIVFKKAKRLSTNTADEMFCTAPEKIFPQSAEATLQTVQDVLKLKSYTSGPNCDRVCVVALEGFGFVEEGTSAQMYPALEEKAGQMPGDFETGLNRKVFNSKHPTAISSPVDSCLQRLEKTGRSQVEIAPRRSNSRCRCLSAITACGC